MENPKSEQWAYIYIDGVIDQPDYMVSNYGRLKSSRGIINGSTILGYKSLNLKLPVGSGSSERISFNQYVHKLVARYFLDKPSPGRDRVIHLDYDKTNNRYDNLQYASNKEVAERRRKSGSYKLSNTPNGVTNSKLTITKVREIKYLLKNTSQKKRHIAAQYGITHTQLNRICSGENWGYVTI